MNIPLDSLLSIVAYREFYDVPRLILAGDKSENYWVLDCSFDDGGDDYSPSYAVFFVGHDVTASREAFELWSRAQTGLYVGVIEVDSVRFDDTRRRELMCSKMAARP